MVDPTSNLCEDVPVEEAPRCAVCNEPIQEEPTHRVVTRVEDDTVVTKHFCDSSCRAEWDG